MGRLRKQPRTDMALVRQEDIGPSIETIRGQKVLLDIDLAQLYNVPVRVLNQAVKRNRSRFPGDFMFQLSWEEAERVIASRSQIVTLKRGRNVKYRPFVFTEHGAVMLASILNSPVAVAASIQVVRAFVRLRQVLATSEEFRDRLDAIEKKLEDHDQSFAVVFEAIRKLMDEEEEERPLKPKIGFETEGRETGRLSYTSGPGRRPVGRIVGLPLHE